MRVPHLAFRLLGIVLAFLLVANLRSIFASETQLIDTQIKISVCGNGIVEGGEDCEGLDLNGQSCVSLGFASGDLFCDLACSFDTYSCVLPTPTPTPLPTATPVPTTEPTPAPTIVELVVTPTPELTPIVLVTPTPAPNLLTELLTSVAEVVQPSRVLPPPLQKFDTKGTGVLVIEDLEEIVQKWVDGWQQYLTQVVDEFAAKQTVPPTVALIPDPEAAADCDLNEDGVCDLIDFSILLHYIEP